MPASWSLIPTGRPGEIARSFQHDEVCAGRVEIWDAVREHKMDSWGLPQKRNIPEETWCAFGKVKNRSHGIHAKRLQWAKPGIRQEELHKETVVYCRQLDSTMSIRTEGRWEKSYCWTELTSWTVSSESYQQKVMHKERSLRSERALWEEGVRWQVMCVNVKVVTELRPTSSRVGWYIQCWLESALSETTW